MTSHAFSGARLRDTRPLCRQLSQRHNTSPRQALSKLEIGMHVVRQDPRMVRSDPDCILGHSAGALPRMWQLDLDTVSVGRSCDGNTVRGIRVVCCWALANNMIQQSKGRLFLVRYSRWLRCRAGSGPLVAGIAQPAAGQPEGRLHAIH